MKTNFLQLKNLIASAAPTVVGIFGNDSYLVNKAVETIENSSNLEFAELNRTFFDETADAASIVNACMAVPFMSARRIVVVKDYAVPKAEAEKIKMRDYIYKPNDETALVLVFKEKTGLVDFDLPLVVDCDKLDIGSLTNWIVIKARQSGKRISSNAAQTVVEYCLFDMSRIAKETEKLCVYSDEEITLDAVNLLVEKESEYVVFELAQEIAKRHPDKAMEIAANLLDKGEEVTFLVATVYSQFRRMFYSIVNASSLKELAVMLNVKEFAVKKAREAADNFTPVQLKKALMLCEKADEEVKSFSADKINVFYGLVLGLLNLQGVTL
jgi:DNA polymerase-3 subunit delta